MYGNTAEKLAEPVNGCTHSWKLYVKPYYEEVMSAYVRNVQFTLDKSYNSPTRVIFKEPYEISELGYAEFEASIKIHFVGKFEKTVSLVHKVNLFKSDENIEINNLIVKECYDEIVFPSPFKPMRYRLNRSVSNKPAGHFVNFEQESQHLVERLKLAQSKAKEEIATTKENCKKLQAKIEILQKAALNL